MTLKRQQNGFYIYHAVILAKDADIIANGKDPDQNTPYTKNLGRPSGLVVEHRTPEREVGFDPHSGLRDVSLSKIHSPPKKYW